MKIPAFNRAADRNMMQDLAREIRSKAKDVNYIRRLRRSYGTTSCHPLGALKHFFSA